MGGRATPFEGGVMKLVVSRYQSGAGWVEPLDPSLDSERTLVLVFGAPAFRDDADVLASIARAFPTSIVTGCSTAGEILDDRLTDDGLVVAVARFEHTPIRLAGATIGAPAESREVGAGLARELDAADLRGIVVLSDGLHVNGSELARGINESLERGVPVTGGLAGDGARFASTWVLWGGAPVSGRVAAIGFYGPQFVIGHGSRGGWDKFGPERRVTRSSANVLYEIDGRPALELYKKYLGERASELPSSGLLFPLSLRPDTDDAEPVVRTLLGVDEATQSMTFAGDLPQGWLVQLMSANFDRLVQGAADAGRMAGERAERVSGDLLNIAISCVGRRLVLGERVEEELEAVLEGSPPRTRQVGFYSYGELSPHASGRCDLHNQTMTLTTFGELERRAA